jgi:hypothetical protein
MKMKVSILMALIIILALCTGVNVTGQIKSFEVTDFVDLPEEIRSVARNKQLPGKWVVEFQEEWSINTERRSLEKRVLSFDPQLRDLHTFPDDSLQSLFVSLLEHLPKTSESKRIAEITYEFNLLDPHMKNSGNRAIPEVDSMDLQTGELQAALIGLVERLRNPWNVYSLERDMLSVYFHETWLMDPGTGLITKKVEGITPVIWQRRRTSDGEYINDGDTGMPVYYKNPLQRIDLRNP